MASTIRRPISQIFINKNVQKLLLDITRFDEGKLFARAPVKKLKSPKLVFMSDEQLKKAKEESYELVKARLQMPPVMEPDTSQPEVISKDEELVGYTKFKVMFVDITPGYTNRTRLMSVRETDGTLRYPTHEERSRLNHIYYPDEHRSIDEPQLFQEENLQKLLRRREYIYILNRACIQFEPDDKRYVNVTSQVYDYIDDVRDYDMLRSTRHFGPMALYLVYNKRYERLMDDMIAKKYTEDAKKLEKLVEICESAEPLDEINYDDK